MVCGRGSQTSFNSLKQRNKKGGGKASLGLPSFNVAKKSLKKTQTTFNSYCHFNTKTWKDRISKNR